MIWRRFGPSWGRSGADPSRDQTNTSLDRSSVGTKPPTRYAVYPPPHAVCICLRVWRLCVCGAARNSLSGRPRAQQPIPGCIRRSTRPTAVSRLAACGARLKAGWWRRAGGLQRGKRLPGHRKCDAWLAQRLRDKPGKTLLAEYRSRSCPLLAPRCHTCLHKPHFAGTRPCGQPVQCLQFFFKRPCGHALHCAHACLILPWGHGLHAEQCCFNFPWGHPLQIVHLCFTRSCGQPLQLVQYLLSLPCGHLSQIAQACFIFPCGQPEHAAHRFFTLPCSHPLQFAHSRFTLPCGHLLQVRQCCLNFPCGQPEQNTHHLFTLPCGHGEHWQQ